MVERHANIYIYIHDYTHIFTCLYWQLYMSIEYVGILLNPAFNSWNQSLLSACPTNTSQTGKRKATTSMFTSWGSWSRMERKNYSVYHSIPASKNNQWKSAKWLVLVINNVQQPTVSVFLRWMVAPQFELRLGRPSSDTSEASIAWEIKFSTMGDHLETQQDQELNFSILW